ncbi:helix-turn-helix transcriptional regulator [Gloeocapsopsis crepidinum LEGE 06123]|uniref:Helix-turn-helix transcriptional regulator n=1 Tax=Gloeocapsopsis crepidinum LEGE 06123 TaxID=588587 RepID=A0ABR9UVR7_9CHRO|nr:helix-turn-helix transcriptional regulator [Gloeocapsopsis crepidinum]MBE9191408.1 helix-turn-helix transcriptional regulator [Gloeocapsopsis crepidinum LEGE 06123]
MLTEETLEALSLIERRIVRLIYADYNAAEIAVKMGYSVPNIHYHLKKVYRKFGVSNKRELRAYLHDQPKPKQKSYQSCVVNAALAPDHYRDTLFYKQKRVRICNAVYQLKFRCDSVWISSKREWQKELDNIIAVVLQELS